MTPDLFEAGAQRLQARTAQQPRQLSKKTNG